jgi:hypothetical protein
MRHDPMTGVFSGAYINHRVKFNTQDAFLERDVSDDGLTRAFAHMNIRCNPGIPKEAPAVVLQALPPDPDIADLERRHTTMFQQLRHRYKFVKRAPPKQAKEYQDLGRLRGWSRVFRSYCLSLLRSIREVSGKMGLVS